MAENNNESYGMYRIERMRIICPYKMGSNPVKDIQDTKREFEIYMVQTTKDKIILVIEKENEVE